MFFVNITNVKITTHPEYISWSRKAILTLTEYEQIGISKKARRHLLINTDLPIISLINSGNFTTSEKTQANNLASNLLIRAGLEINNIDIYREQMTSNLFVQAIYLQNLDFKLINTSINTSGTFMMTVDPLNLVIYDSVVDTYPLTENLVMYFG